MSKFENLDKDVFGDSTVTTIGTKDIQYFGFWLAWTGSRKEIIFNIWDSQRDLNTIQYNIQCMKTPWSVSLSLQKSTKSMHKLNSRILVYIIYA